MQATSQQHHKVPGIVLEILRVVVPISVSVLLVVWLFHKVNFAQVREIMSHGVDYRYLVLMMIIIVMSHIIRGIRWGIQLRGVGIPRIPVVAESVSIFGDYSLNLILPFLGEAWRCLYIAKRQNCKLATVVGTDIGDRASDGIMISIIIVFTFFVAKDAIMKFLDHYKFGEELLKYCSDGKVWLGLLALIAVIALLYWLLRKTKFVQGINLSIKRMWTGFAVLFHMKQTGLYIVLTVLIWVCYFFETYVCFFAFPFTRELIQSQPMFALVPGLVVFVFGSISMIVPSNAGLGPWNIAVIFALSLYGISETDGAAYSVLVWSFQAFALIAEGVFSVFYIMWERRHLQRANAA